MLDLKKIPQETYEKLKAARWKARTDLGWLCRNILNYPDVSDVNGGPWNALHQPLIERVQHFPYPNATQWELNDKLVNGKWVYTPLVPMLELPGKRRRLILDSRSFLKTTVNTIAHSIQWIINYPDIAMLILMAADTRAKDVLSELKKHFQFNPRFRELFPEHCPQRNVNDWGTQDRFVTEARGKSIMSKEPTVMTGSIEKGAAGYHFHVIKFSDIVDENNIQGQGLQNVRNKFDISLNLLINPLYWMDVEGTRYHFGDTYGKIIEREMKSPEEEREYEIFIRGIYRRKVPGGEKFTTEEYKLPFELDEDGKRISRWPERFPTKLLEKEEDNDLWIFSCQKLNSPVMNVEGMAPFPVNDNFPKKISRADFKQNVRIAYKEICVDFASTDNQRSNYNVITVGTTDHNGRLYIEEIKWGRMLANQAVDTLFEIATKHYRHLRAIKIEESEYLRGLMPTIERKLDLYYRPRGMDFTFEFIKRGNRTSKNDRIYKSLQPWYAGIRMAKDEREITLRFLDDIEPLAFSHLIMELEQFPACDTDDILDTLADFLMDKEYFGREKSRSPHNDEQVNRIFKAVQKEAWDKWLDMGNPFERGVNNSKIVTLL